MNFHTLKQQTIRLKKKKEKVKGSCILNERTYTCFTQAQESIMFIVYTFG